MNKNYRLDIIKDLIWEFDNGSISPHNLVKALKEITNYNYPEDTL